MRPIDLCVGIDIGDANISAMYIERKKNGEWGEPTPVKVMGEEVVSYPSYFTINRREEKVIGKHAKNGIGNNPILSRAKSLLGKRFEKVDEDRLRRHYGLSIGKDRNGYAAYDVMVNDERRLISPREIYRAFIDMIIEQVLKTSHHEKIDHVVITVPVNFDEEQRGTFLSIVQQCGIPEDHITTIYEPLATTMFYADKIVRQEELSDHYILVFDLGSGTFDMSIECVKKSEVKHCYYYGDCACAGHDLTLLMMQLISGKCGLIMDSLCDKQRRQLLLKAEEAKEILSTYTTTDVDLHEINHHLGIIPVTREEFEKEIDDKLSAIIGTMDEAITRSTIRKETISRVILVGGSTFIPLLRRKLVAYFGRDDIIYDKLARNTSVAAGAAIYKPMMDRISELDTDNKPEPDTCNKPELVSGNKPEPDTCNRPELVSSNKPGQDPNKNHLSGSKLLSVIGGAAAGALSIAAYYFSGW